MRGILLAIFSAMMVLPSGMATCKICKAVMPQVSLAKHRQRKHGAQNNATPKPGQPKKMGKNLLGEDGAGQRTVVGSVMGGGQNKLRKLLPSDLGSTVAGASWALKCLNPCGEDSGGCYGIPDTTNLQVCLPEGRGQLVMSGPPQATEALQPWDCVLIFPDIVEVQCVVFKKRSIDSWKDVRDGLNGATPGAWAAPEIHYYSLFSGSTMSRDGDKWRTTARGSTTHLVANALTDQGMVYADNWPSDFIPVEAPAVEAKAAGDEKEAVSAIPALNGYFYNLPPITASDMVGKSVRLYQANSRHGSYVIQYPTSATGAMPYFSAETLANDNPDAGIQIQFKYPDQGGSLSNSEVQHNAYVGARTLPGYRALGGFTSGMVLYEGLDPKASIQIKTRHAIEMVPTNVTIAQAFTQLSPMLDRAALDVVSRVAQTAWGAYPANYNDLGKILGNIWGAIKGVAAPIGNLAEVVSGMGIPYVSNGASLVAGLANLIR